MRYVVLHHTDYPGQPDHFDLMLAVDADGPLKTWRLTRWPAASGDVAEPIHDHRRRYLTYEGPISGGRGEVRRVAAGEADILAGASGTVRLGHAGLAIMLTAAGPTRLLPNPSPRPP